MHQIASHHTEFATSADDLDSIRVTELPDDGQSSGLCGGVLTAYRHQGFEAGYALARHEIRSRILLVTAEFFRDHAGTNPEVREALCKFQAHLDRQLSQVGEPSYLEGGLGI
jgi:hypothetical protein